MVMSFEASGADANEGSEDSGTGEACEEEEAIGKTFENRRKVIATAIRNRTFVPCFLKGGQVPSE